MLFFDFGNPKSVNGKAIYLVMTERSLHDKYKAFTHSYNRFCCEMRVLYTDDSISGSDDF